MAKTFSISTKGFEKAQRDLLKLNAGLRRKVLRTAAQAGILPIQNRAKQLSPYKTGENRRRITSRVTRANALSATAATGPNTPYGRRLEFGFQGRDRRGRRFNQRAQPYMRPAFRTKRNEAAETMARVMWEGAVKAAGGRNG